MYLVRRSNGAARRITMRRAALSLAIGRNDLVVVPTRTAAAGDRHLATGDGGAEAGLAGLGAGGRRGGLHLVEQVVVLLAGLVRLVVAAGQLAGVIDEQDAVLAGHAADRADVGDG